jgi:phenylacetate-CoA ligase
LYKWLVRSIFAPSLDFWRGSRTLSCLKGLSESQWWPPEKLQELQNKLLVQLINHACENVPYYHRVFAELSLKPADITGTDDLAKLPLLTKRLVRESFTELIARNVSAGERITLQTGGSTGEPLSFYRSRNDQVTRGFAAALRALTWAGFEHGDKSAKLTVIRPYESNMARWWSLARNFLERVLVLDAKRLSTETIPLYARRLHEFQPEFIRGYPSAIELLARYISDNGKYNLKPRAIITGAEQLYDYQRELFRQVFGCETFSYYSSWEVHAIASECELHCGLHIASENVIVEIVDDSGLPVGNGREGKIVLTNLHNYAMPFIRYEIGDIGALSDDSCPCGRSLPLLTRLTGRTSDVLVTREGRTIPGAALVFVFREPMGIQQFRIIQESYDSVTIAIVMDKEYSEDHLKQVTSTLANKFRKLLGENITVIVKIVNAIPLTPDGKHRVVISHAADLQ